MKIPALRINMGIWKYYVSYLSFDQIESLVKKIDTELHKSEKLQDLIQRSITKNAEDIKDYILTQTERFFNALVLAVYDGDPKWMEMEVGFRDEEFFELGFLIFTGEEKIFPVDGQHRVEGIKMALNENKELSQEKVAVLFIGHRKNKDGMERSRRLFTTLNRYAKPVTMDDIIALDEDDSAAIITRSLLENYPLFNDKRIVKAKQKAIQEYNKKAITSIITLYQCNKEILKLFLAEYKLENKSLRYKSFKKFLKFRPNAELLDDFNTYVENFWNHFSSELSTVKKYLSDKGKEPAQKYRNKETGGNLLFRPVGLLPFIQAVLIIKKREGTDYETIFKGMNKLNLELNRKPWQYVLWNPTENKMIMGSSEIVKLLIIYLYNKNILYNKEMTKLKEGYAAKIAYDGNINNVLRGIK